MLKEFISVVVSVIMNLSVAQRLAIGFGLLIALLTISNLFAIRGVNKINDDLQEIVVANSAQMRSASILIDRAQEIRVQYRQLLIDTTPDAQAKTKEKYDAARQEFAREEENLNKLFTNPLYPPTPTESAALKNIQEQKDDAFATVDQLIQLTMAGKVDDAKALLSSGAAPKMSKLNATLRELAEYENKLNAEKVGHTDQNVSTTKTTMVVLTVVAVLLGAAAGVLITRSITVPLGGMQQFVQNLATNFDFTQRLPVNSQDEIGRSIGSLNGLLDSLQNSMKLLNRVGRDVTVSVNSLSSTSREMSQTSHAVSESASAMAAGIEQVTVSIGHVADRAQECDHTAREAGRLAATGGTVIEGTISSINQIADQVRASATQIESLKERTATINAVVNVIKDIADQTNLLALNAAIEAARAGDLGRGFAVVADEVRKLAERTASSTQEIISTVAAIQNEANSTVQTMQQTVRQVDEGVSRAQEASSAINDIRRSADTVVDQVSEISTAMREQSSASSAMAQQVERVAQMSEESSAAAASTAGESSRLNNLGQELDQSISRYRV
ncbi:methyl-accepting chemotaxis protein [Chitinibacter bivalviorum]|uniref:Methyl-accepting chemotaxis protein n=1 Tax=Chitinibacter bivalviorum TaxID=2739434 RepID=A0A7H9BKK4_9NEIS|nr:HAMP domain-containing methyl-accepting chemotaxis protein [Chitinibacter bivalviorum]QLG89019.1 methyl-accepting chemotaxis protein [Chitinibacter bivalviorum]